MSRKGANLHRDNRHPELAASIIWLQSGRQTGKLGQAAGQLASAEVAVCIWPGDTHWYSGQKYKYSSVLNL
jgi:hypothetical protein